MRDFPAEDYYAIHRRHIARIWLMILQYSFFIAAIVCMIAIAWDLFQWIRYAVMVVVLLFAGAVCKTGRQS